MVETTLGNGLLLLPLNEQNSIQQIRNNKDNHYRTPSDKTKT